MNPNRRPSPKKTIRSCDPSRVVKNQSRPHCAWGPHQDRRDVRFRLPHALAAGCERLADWALADGVALDISCVDTDRYPDPDRPDYYMIQFCQIELTNHSSVDCSGQARIGADRATAAMRVVVGF